MEITLVEVDFPFGDKPEQERPTFKGRLHICGKTTTHAVDLFTNGIGTFQVEKCKAQFFPIAGVSQAPCGILTNELFNPHHTATFFRNGFSSQQLNYSCQLQQPGAGWEMGM